MKRCSAVVAALLLFCSQALAAFGIFQIGTTAPAFTYNIVTDGGATCSGVSEDAAAFNAFSIAALAFQSTHAGQLIQLTIPSGKVCTLATEVGNSKNFTAGISNLVVSGYSATLRDAGGQGFFLGGGSTSGISQNTVNSFALVQTVSAGATCITTVTAGDAAKWAVNDYATITGGDQQGYGFPPNPYVWEFVKVISVNAGTGQVCFDAALTHSYKSTWPSYTTGQTPFLGGPATLYAFDNQFWNTTQEYKGLTIDVIQQDFAIGRDIRFTDVTFSNGSFIPTQNGSFTCTNCTFTTGIEVDKIIGTFTLINSTVGLLDWQSSSAENFVLTNSTITTLNGGAKKLSTITGSTITNFTPGSHSYGAAGEMVVSNSTLTNITTNGAFDTDTTRKGVMTAGVFAVPKTISFTSAANDGSGQVKVAVADSSAYTAGLLVAFSSSTPSCNGSFEITVPDATHIVLVGSTFVSTCTGSMGNNPLTWAVQGANVYTKKSYNYSASGFQITDITQDANQTYIHTSLAGGFPTTPNGGTPPITVQVHSAPKFTCTNCTGSVEAVDLSNPGAAGVPLWSYSKRTMTASSGAPTQATVPVWGALVSANVTVTVASNAAGAMDFTFDAPNPFVETSAGTSAFWTTSVNAKIASVTPRVFTPTTTSGAQAGDSLVAPGAGTWLLNDQIKDQFSSAPAGGDPVSVIVEITTNQNVVWP